MKKTTKTITKTMVKQKKESSILIRNLSTDLEKQLDIFKKKHDIKASSRAFEYAMGNINFMDKRIIELEEELKDCKNTVYQYGSFIDSFKNMVKFLDNF